MAQLCHGRLLSLAGLELELGAASRRDVARDALHADRLALLHDQPGADLQRHAPAVLGDDHELVDDGKARDDLTDDPQLQKAVDFLKTQKQQGGKSVKAG